MKAARWHAAIALLAGASMVLAFAPFNVYPLAILSPAILFYFWSEAGVARSAWLGFLFGLGLFGAGASWVYVSIHEFGFMPAPMAAILVFLFVSLLAVFPAIAGGLQARIPALSWQRIVFVIPVVWVLAEWLRGWVLTGFPWLHLGYAHSSSTLMNVAPLAGVLGVSLLSAVLSALLVIVMRHPGRVKILAVSIFVTLLIAVWFAGKLEFVEPAGESFSVSLVQGNVPLAEKWKAGSSKQIIKKYVELSRININEAQLIVWPEGAIPDSWQHAIPTLVRVLPKRRDETMPDYLLGAIDNAKEGEYFNSAVKINESNTVIEQQGIYRKRHLVPFGEYLPFKSLLGWLINYLKIPMSDFTAWETAQDNIELAGWPAAVNICYEDAFGEELIANAAEAAYLVNVSEDAWFGDSLAPHQRLQMAQFRARETGRYFVRAANTGFTAVINEKGEITSQLEQFKAGVLLAEVTPMKGLTPYVRYGNSVVLILMLFLLLPVLITKWRHKS